MSDELKRVRIRSAPSHLLNATRVAAGLGQWVGAVVLAFLLLACVALGILGIWQLAEPVHWGTFTQERCEPALRGCREFGIWVSDDGETRKESIELDGSVGASGSVRASYQPTGLNSNIVHTEPSTNAGPWIPWLVALAIAVRGWPVFKGLRARRRRAAVDRSWCVPARTEPPRTGSIRFMSELIVEIHVPLVPTPGLDEGEYAFPWIDDVENFLFGLDGDDRGERFDDGEELGEDYVFFIWQGTEDSLLGLARSIANIPGVPAGVFAVVTDTDSTELGSGRRVDL